MIEKTGSIAPVREQLLAPDGAIESFPLTRQWATALPFGKIFYTDLRRDSIYFSFSRLGVGIDTCFNLRIVTPAKAGVQKRLENTLDSRIRGYRKMASNNLRPQPLVGAYCNTPPRVWRFLSRHNFLVILRISLITGIQDGGSQAWYCFLQVRVFRLSVREAGEIRYTEKLFPTVPP